MFYSGTCRCHTIPVNQIPFSLGRNEKRNLFGVLCRWDKMHWFSWPAGRCDVLIMSHQSFCGSIPRRLLIQPGTDTQFSSSVAPRFYPFKQPFSSCSFHLLPTLIRSSPPSLPPPAPPHLSVSCCIGLRVPPIVQGHMNAGASSGRTVWAQWVMRWSYPCRGFPRTPLGAEKSIIGRLAGWILTLFQWNLSLKLCATE